LSANPKYLKGAQPQNKFHPQGTFVYEMKFLLMRRVDKARVCFTAVLGRCPAALRYFSTRAAKKSAGRRSLQ
jgi:hypothetical protein